MSAKTGIEWTDATWSPLRVRVREDAADIARRKGYTSLIQIAEKMRGRVGQHCEHVSGGCKHCYSGTWQTRCLKVNGTGLPFDRRSRDLVDPFVDEKALSEPLRWRGSKRVFVENQSDLFGEWCTDEQIDRVFGVMALCPQHTFQVLTKRPERMLAYISNAVQRVDDRYQVNVTKLRSAPIVGFRSAVARFRGHEYDGRCAPLKWPLPNVWLGVSVEDQATADARIPLLLQTPAAKRFVSYEPALGPVDLTVVSRTGKPRERFGPGLNALTGRFLYCQDSGAHLDWVICGGESGPGARPMHPDWARSIRDQCVAAGVPFFFKQWGEFVSVSEVAGKGRHHHFPDGATVRRVGKKKAGALLDGVEWRQFPS